MFIATNRRYNLWPRQLVLLSVPKTFEEETCSPIFVEYVKSEIKMHLTTKWIPLPSQLFHNLFVLIN